MEYENYEVRYSTVGWSYMCAHVYDKTKLKNSFTRFLSNWFGYGCVHKVACVQWNGFKDSYFESDIKMMTKTEYLEKIVKPAMEHYKKYLDAQKTWD